MPTGFFFYSDNAPDAKVILNRNTDFQFDISSDVLSFNTSNDVNSAFGSFTVVIDNTNDKHVDRFGVPDVAVMSSVEIFVKSNIANSNKIPKATNPTSVSTREGQSLNSIVEDTYGITSYSAQNGMTAEDYRLSYLQGIALLNVGLDLKFIGGSTSQITSATNVATIADFQLQGGQRIKLPPPITDYKRIFLGVVQNVQQSFSAGSSMTITLTGESFGYWLRASTVNISPALNEVGTGSATNTGLSVYANKYSESQALDIFRDLIKFSSNDTLTVADYSLGTNNTSYENLNSDDLLKKQVKDELGNPFIDSATGRSLTLQTAFEKAFKGKGIQVEKTLAGILNGLDELEQSVRNGTYLDGSEITDIESDPNSTNTVEQDFNGYKTTSAAYTNAQTNLQNVTQQAQANLVVQTAILTSNPKGSTASNAAQASIDADDAKIRSAQSTLNSTKSNLDNNPVMQQQLNTINDIRGRVRQQIDNTSQSGRKVLEQLGIIEHWKDIFSRIVLEVANASYLQRVYPFKWILKSPAIMDGDYQPKSTIAKQVADALNFEFYMDTNGHFVVKPPLYNIGIPDDDPTYVIEQEDLISMNINDTVDGIITRVGVTGDVFLPVQLERLQTYNVHTDLNLVGKYGVHNTELQNLIFLRTPQDCKDYGESYMAKNNQELRNASITVMGRPDIRLGVACYLKPRDTVYYIKAISHDFSVGAEYTTTLTLVGARKIIAGYLAKSKVNTLAKATIDGILIRSTTNNDEENTISHYILANSLSPSIYATTNFNTNTSSPQINSPQTQDFSVIKNSYIIISHPNIGYVGLIVDQNNIILNDINYNTFKYIYDAAHKAVTSTLKATSENLQSNFGKNIEPFLNIQNFLLDFINANNIGGGIASGEGETKRKNLETALNNEIVFNQVANGFNQAVLNKYFAQFTNFIDAQASAAREGHRTVELQTWNATASYFNQMIMDVGTVGSYRQYTDEFGREYPVLLDYGKGLKIENTELNMKDNSAAQKATNQQDKTNSEVDEIIKAAKLNLGNQSQASIPRPSESSS